MRPLRTKRRGAEGRTGDEDLFWPSGPPSPEGKAISGPRPDKSPSGEGFNGGRETVNLGWCTFAGGKTVILRHKAEKHTRRDGGRKLDFERISLCGARRSPGAPSPRAAGATPAAVPGPSSGPECRNVHTPAGARRRAPFAEWWGSRPGVFVDGGIRGQGLGIRDGERGGWDLFRPSGHLPSIAGWLSGPRPDKSPEGKATKERSRECSTLN